MQVGYTRAEAIAANTGIQIKRRYNQWLKSIVTFSQREMLT